MLSKLIVNAYKIIIEVALWATLFIAIVAGWHISDITGALFGAVVWLFGATVFFGAFLVLLDIRGRVKSIETLQRN